jgi:hypothetical protein
MSKIESTRSQDDVAPSNDLAARIQRLEDERQIRQLTDLHCFLSDAGPAEAFKELYTEDCVVDLGRLMSPERTTVIEGRSRLLKEIYLDPGHRAWEGRSQHFGAGPQAIHIVGDHADAITYAITTLLYDGVPKTIVVGFNFWKLTRTSGRWRIARRIARRLGDEDVPQLFAPIVRQVCLELGQ